MVTIGKVSFWWDNETECYDLEVLDPSATVADYEKTVGGILATPEARKKYSEHCVACSICCGGRLPLTVVDIYRLKFGGLGMALPLNGWVAAYGVVQRQDGCVDVTLRLDERETCALWNRNDGLCSVYEKRPLICRTYICTPLSWRASELRGQIVNSGEDELVRMLGLPDGNGGKEKPQPFSGVLDYGGVLLRDVCSVRLWHSLTKRDGAMDLLGG
jgi:Fe-S-cluster containining protein